MCVSVCECVLVCVCLYAHVRTNYFMGTVEKWGHEPVALLC